MAQSEQEFEENEVTVWLEEQGWTVLDQKDSPFADYFRSSETDVLFEETLKEKLGEINGIEGAELESAFTEVKRTLTGDGHTLFEKNQNAIELLRSGGLYTRIDEKKPFDVFDFEQPSNNDFLAVRQFRHLNEDEGIKSKPDIVLFINGLPVSVIELKNVNSKTTTDGAIDQIQNKYERYAEELFIPNIYNIVLNQSDIRYGAVGSDMYHEWRDSDDEVMSDVEKYFKMLVEPERMFRILRWYTFYTNSGEKILPRHQQYDASETIVRDVRESDEPTTNLINHVQGSGKSYTMIFAGYILSELFDKQVFIVVDEQELVRQFGEDLESIQEVTETVIDSQKVGETGTEQLDRVVSRGETGVVLTILHLFNEIESKSPVEPVVFADEAHRYLTKQLGTKMEYCLSPFYYYGFTGTPIEETYEKFADPEELELHEYSMKEAIADDAILPVDMVSRRDLIDWTVYEDSLDEEFEEEFGDLSEDEKKHLLYESLSTEDIAGIRDRVEIIVEDIVRHFKSELWRDDERYKGMVVTKGKENAAQYGQLLEDELGEDAVDVIYSKTNDDPPEVRQYHKTSSERKDVIEDFKEKANPKILVVCDMLRTGFDAPVLKTIYLDRMFDGGHTLLQTLARANRPRRTKSGEKEFGQIIDYQGVTEDFEEMVNYDSDEIDTFKSEDKEMFKEQFVEQLESIEGFFDKTERDNLREWANELDSTDAQKEYMRMFRKLCSLYRDIQPDDFIYQFEDRYDWLEQVYNVVRTHHKQKANEVGSESLRMVNDNVEVSKNEEYIETRRRVDSVRKDSMSVVKKKKTLENFLSSNQRFDPRFSSLSQRVENIIERWDRDEISTEDAYDLLEEVNEEKQSIQHDIRNSTLSPKEQSVKALLEDYGLDDEVELAKDIVEKFDDKLPAVPNWWNKQNQRKNVKSKITMPVYDEGYYEIANNENFQRELLDLLIKTYKQEE